MQASSFPVKMERVELTFHSPLNPLPTFSFTFLPSGNHCYPLVTLPVGDISASSVLPRLYQAVMTGEMPLSPAHLPTNPTHD